MFSLLLNDLNFFSDLSYMYGFASETVSIIKPYITLNLQCRFQWYCLASHESPVARQHIASVESSSLILHDTLCDLLVLP